MFFFCSMLTIILCRLWVKDWLQGVLTQYMVCILSTVLAVERVSEEDVLSGFYHFPASTDINGNYVQLIRIEI